MTKLSPRIGHLSLACMITPAVILILGLCSGCCDCFIRIQYHARGYVPVMLMKVNDSVAIEGRRIIAIESPNRQNVSKACLPRPWKDYMYAHGKLRVVIRTTHKGVDTLVLYPGTCDTTITYDLGDEELKFID